MGAIAGKILIECCLDVAATRQKESAPAGAVGYEDVAEAAFGKLGRAVIQTTMYTELLGICSLLFIWRQESP